MSWNNPVITAVVAAAVGLAVWYFQSRIEGLRRARERLHDDRRKVYMGILEPFVRLFAGVKDPAQNDKALQQMLSFEYKQTAFEFSMIGADQVVRAFNDLMQHVYASDPQAGGTPNPKELMRLWAECLLEIRKSIGDPDTKLQPIDMLRSQIKGIDEFFGSTA